MIERRLTEENPGFITLVTIVETVWMLNRVYGPSNHEAAEVVERILQADRLLVQNDREVFIAMPALKAGTGPFSDALIGALGAWAGCTATLTFDKKEKRLKQFELL